MYTLRFDSCHGPPVASISLASSTITKKKEKEKNENYLSKRGRKKRIDRSFPEFYFADLDPSRGIRDEASPRVEIRGFSSSSIDFAGSNREKVIARRWEEAVARFPRCFYLRPPRSAVSPYPCRSSASPATSPPTRVALTPTQPRLVPSTASCRICKKKNTEKEKQ